MVALRLRDTQNPDCHHSVDLWYMLWQVVLVIFFFEYSDLLILHGNLQKLETIIASRLETRKVNYIFDQDTYKWLKI
jgi:hypothetical protein